jgi:hypothetical protein
MNLPVLFSRSRLGTLCSIGAGVALLAATAQAQPLTVTFGGKNFTNQGLVGVGRLPANLKDKFGETFGSFSAFMFNQQTWTLTGTTFTGTLYAQPDRGFNVAGTTDYVSRLNVLSVSFTPAPAGSAQQNQVRLTLTDTIQYKEGNGTVLTSLDPTASGTGTRAGFPALPQAFNGKISLDPEGIVRARDGSFYVSDEYGPYIYKFSSTGVLLAAIRPPEALIPVRNGAESFASNNPGPGQPAPVPADPVTGRQNNQGLEGLTISPDGKTLFALLQSATRQDGGTGGGSATRGNTRLLAYNISGATPTLVAEYIVPLPTYLAGTATRVAAQSEMVALNDKQFLVLARDGNGRGTATPTSLYRNILLYDISTATNTFDTAGTPVAPGGVLTPSVVAARSVALIDMNDSTQLAKFGLRNGPTDDANNLSEKWEGLALVPALDPNAPNDVYLFVGNDNDFITTDGFQAGTAYNAGLDNDNMILVYRLTMPTYVDPLAMHSAAVTGVGLVQALHGQVLSVSRMGSRDLGGHLANLRLGRVTAPGLSAFASGDWSQTDDDARAGYAGYSADAWSATGGVQYQLGRRVTLGLAASRLEGDADLPGSLGTIATRGAGLTAFFSVNGDAAYVNAAYTRNDLDYELTRVTGAYGLNAAAATAGHSSVMQLQTGWRQAWAGFLFTLEGGVDRVQAEADAFTETGAIHMNLAVPTLAPRSIRWHGGLQVSRELDMGGLRLTPYVAAEYSHEHYATPEGFTLVLAGREGVAGASVTGTALAGQEKLWRGRVGLAAALGDKCWAHVEGGTWLNSDYGDQTSLQVSLRYQF